MLEFTYQNGTLRFSDHVTTFSDKNLSFEGVTNVDFNNVEHLLVDLNLESSLITHLDLKNIITAKKIFLPTNCSIKENLYWADKIYTHIVDDKYKNPVKVFSSRLGWMSVYNNNPFVYLSGTVVGYLDLRKEQRYKLMSNGYGVYSPGNHMTLGDPVADKYPKLVFDIDIKAMEAADIIFFDLNNLSAGTSAELGYSIAKGWHKTKKLVGIYNNKTQNFFINGLTTFIKLYESLDEFIELNKYVSIDKFDL